MMGSFSKLPSGNVLPSVFVTLQSDGTVQATASNGDAFGISQPSTHKFPIAGWDDGYAGVAGGPPINIYGPGDDECLLWITATVTPGQYLKADAGGLGKGIPVTTDGDCARAKAITGGIAGDLIRVKPVLFDIGTNAPI